MFPSSDQWKCIYYDVQQRNGILTSELAAMNTTSSRNVLNKLRRSWKCDRMCVVLVRQSALNIHEHHKVFVFSFFNRKSLFYVDYGVQVRYHIPVTGCEDPTLRETSIQKELLQIYEYENFLEKKQSQINRQKDNSGILLSLNRSKYYKCQ